MGGFASLLLLLCYLPDRHAHAQPDVHPLAWSHERPRIRCCARFLVLPVSSSWTSSGASRLFRMVARMTSESMRCGSRASMPPRGCAAALRAGGERPCSGTHALMHAHAWSRRSTRIRCSRAPGRMRLLIRLPKARCIMRGLSLSMVAPWGCLASAARCSSPAPLCHGRTIGPGIGVREGKRRPL